MNIFQRWKQTTLANKGLVLSGLLMAFGTLFYAGAAIVQICIMQQNARDASIQTEKLIKASKAQACAAKSFAASAEKINIGLGDAVGKLNLQATNLQNSVIQATRLARATEQANQNAINSDRPWMGAALNVDGFVSGKTPSYMVVFTNSGKRPARIELIETISIMRDYGNDPVYKSYGITPSISVAVPGQPQTTVWKEVEPVLNPITDNWLTVLADGTVPFRIYAHIEYTDVSTKSRYWTHACWRYTPKQSPNIIGFSNCTEYNDAK